MAGRPAPAEGPGAERRARLLRVARAVDAAAAGGGGGGGGCAAVAAPGEAGGLPRLPGGGGVDREFLDLGALRSGDAAVARSSMAAYAVPADAREPSSSRGCLAGSLRLFEAPRGEAVASEVILDPGARPPSSGDDPRLRLPSLDFDFVQQGSHFVPLHRGITPSHHQRWDYVVEPGRCWEEDRDRGGLRCSVPFALVERHLNCVHNGVLTFVFSSDEEQGDEKPRPSPTAFQIASETCPSFKFDAWGVLQSEYAPSEGLGASAIESYVVELRGRVPTAPIEDISSSSFSVGGLASEVDPEALSTLGVVYGGTHFRNVPGTRQGPFPFPDALVLPTFSWSKSMALALLLMALAKTYPELDVPGALVADYVPECAENGNWDDVTFLDALSMATGNFESDFDEFANLDFFRHESHGEKIHFACGQYPQTADPGSEFVYHSSDSYILAAGLQGLLRRQGWTGDAYEWLEDHVYAPLDMSPTLSMMRSEAPAEQDEVPLMGWGMVLLPDDIAKISAALLDPDWTAENLDEEVLAGALMEDGSALATKYPGHLYRNGWWGDASLCDGHVVPYWRGLGGLLLALFPPRGDFAGTALYYASDGNAWGFHESAAVLNRVLPEPWCSSPRQGAVPREQKGGDSGER